MLSGKLIPASSQGNDHAAQVFRRNFLEAGGLKYIIDVFQDSTFPLNTNILIVQDCYVTALSLIKFLLCAPPTSDIELDKRGEEEEEREEVPVQFSRQMSKTKSVEDEVARLTIEVHHLLYSCTQKAND